MFSTALQAGARALQRTLSRGGAYRYSERVRSGAYSKRVRSGAYSECVRSGAYSECVRSGAYSKRVHVPVVAFGLKQAKGSCLPLEVKPSRYRQSSRV